MRVILSAVVVLGLAVVPAVAQSDTGVRQPAPPSIPAAPVVEAKLAGPNAGLVTEIADRAEMMIGKPLTAEDGEDVGTVVGVVRDADGKLRAIQADIGGVLGFGAQRISIEPQNVTVTPDGEKLLARTSAAALRQRADGG